MEKQVKDLEDNYTKNEDPVRSVQMDLLQELYAIRECISSPEENLTSELQSLKEENSKLKYRIDHLKRHVKMDEEEKKEEETATLTFPDGKKYPI